ncbi:glycoside hydrolase family 1 protein [Spiroplasma turonicum]|uniref:Aryl-phospho-beta-d-glucosidase n=1 Tax=Spiroplasma turonicum TaxID=216946 RepID=A0A0K1P5H6_9MOLU|nr:glycoside hydrolase family 1 protein [Spiroplasma turonicum]AKU79538.1 aryl-phospho-beta-d-glucosidase [Spiroplasma turonicum]ALX70561.1 6-phospho-beta-glucosidase [Spiroplasma turonicum]
MKNNVFYYSTSSNAFQMEGARNLHGRTDSIWDWYTKTYFKIPPNNSTEREINSIEVASDFYHKYKSDVKIMKDLGLNAFVYNMDWTRIFPKDENYVNPMGLQFYDNLFNELSKNKIKPIPILFHWDTPMWLEIKGGWTSKEILPAFRNYCSTVFKYLGKYTDVWFVNDENKSFTLDGYLGNIFPPCKNSPSDFVKAIHNLNMSAAIAKEEFLKAKNEGYVSEDSILGIDDDWSPPIVWNNGNDEKQNEDLINNYNAWMRDFWIDPNIKGEYPKVFWDYLKENKLDANILEEELSYLQKFKLDFIGWNFYRPYFITNKNNNVDIKLLHKEPVSYSFGDFVVVLPKEHKNYTKWLWPIYPEYLEVGLKAYKDKYNLPIMIIENGFGDFDDKSNELILDIDRINYLQPILESVNKCRKLDLNLFGYSMWTFCDIFSPSAGYRKDYGLVSVDFNSQIKERKPKLSYCYYKNVIMSNGEDTNFDKERLVKELSNLLINWDILWK